MLDICSDMEKLCPDAWLMNYTNPMAIITWAINDYTKIKTVGLCHSVQSTAANLAKYMGVPANEVSYWVAGINHMAWFLELKWKARMLIRCCARNWKTGSLFGGGCALAGPDVVRAEVMKAFGYLSRSPACTCRFTCRTSRNGRN